jgi:hydroxyacid-oxoacid transhydrogenase
MDALRGERIDAVLYDEVRVEPTDGTFMAAAAFASEGAFDGYVAVGGGSVMDTAKAANLYATYPAPLLTYVNPPIGRGKASPWTAQTLIAIPTTAGPVPKRQGSRFSITRPCMPRRGSRTALCGQPLASSTRTTRAPCRPWWPPAPRWTSSRMRLNHLRPCLITVAPRRIIQASDPTYQGANPISDIWAAKRWT